MGGLFARQRRLGSIAIVWRGADGLAPDRAAQALAEGAVLANYEGTSYKTAEEPVAWLERVEVRTGEAPQEAALERGRVLGECTNMARALSNEPGNVLTPREFAERAATLAKAAGVAAEADRPSSRAEEGGQGRGARARRQGDHLRHRRHLDQAVRQHGQDEGRHVGRRRR